MRICDLGSFTFEAQLLSQSYDLIQDMLYISEKQMADIDVPKLKTDPDLTEHADMKPAGSDKFTRPAFVKNFFDTYLRVSFDEGSMFVDRDKLHEAYEELVARLSAICPALNCLSFKSTDGKESSATQRFRQSMGSVFKTNIIGEVPTLATFCTRHNSLWKGLVLRRGGEIGTRARNQACAELAQKYDLDAKALLHSWDSSLSIPTSAVSVFNLVQNHKLSAKKIETDELVETPVSGKRKQAQLTPSRTTVRDTEVPMTDSIFPSTAPTLPRREHKMESDILLILKGINRLESARASNKAPSLRIQSDLVMCFCCPVCRCLDWLVNPYEQADGCRQCVTCSIYMHEECAAKLPISGKNCRCPMCHLKRGQTICAAHGCKAKIKSSVTCQMCCAWFCHEHIQQVELTIHKSQDKKEPLKVQLCEACQANRATIPE